VRETPISDGDVAENAVASTAQRSVAPHLNLVRCEAADVGGRIELLSTEAAAGRHAAWSGLVSRSVEPNVFLEPDFALAAAQHIGSAGRPVFLFVTAPSHRGRPGDLIGLAALQLPRRLGGRGIAKSWCHSQAALSLPLLDRSRGGEALDLVFEWLAREYPSVGAILFPCMPLDGPVMKLIGERAAAGRLRMQSIDRRARAVLDGGSDVQALLARQLSGKRLKELRRQRRRLAEAGVLAYVRNEAKDVRGAAERFLALEASGWKGERGTALLKDRGLATFTRSMTRLLAREDKCSIHSLELDGEPIAMGVVLTSGNQAFLWKIAYDERYAAFSPGVQFIVDFMHAQTADCTLVRTDSCAIADHPMIDRLWPDRLEIADVLIGPTAGRAESFAAIARHESIKRRLRAIVKRVYYATIGRRPS
jgi:CelD/BcsL family acetyltransferase involved in cellulose biosynthesis